MNQIVSFRLCKLSTPQRLDKIDEKVDQMYQNNKIPPRHIPAHPDVDFDLLIGECLVQFKETLEKLAKFKKLTINYQHDSNEQETK